MAKTTAYAGQLLGLYLNATPISTVADNAASTPLTNTYVSLHTGDPGVAGNQSTNEVSYTGYARVAAPFNCSSVNRAPDSATMIGSGVAARYSSLR